MIVHALEKPISGKFKTSDKEKTDQKTVLKDAKKSAEEKKVNEDEAIDDKQASEKLPTYVKIGGAVAFIVILLALYKVMVAKKK